MAAATAMILAAGRGARMRPLSDTTPKPLLTVAGKPLIAYHLENLARAGHREVVINCAHLAEQFPAVLGDGSAYGLHIHYSVEPEGGLETAGGIIRALPLLDPQQFVVVNGDVYCDLELAQLPALAGHLAQLVLVENPPQHPQGDFSIENGTLVAANEQRASYTFAGIARYATRFFADYRAGTEAFVPLRPLFDAQLNAGTIAATVWPGRWTDVGTPERLQNLDEELSAT